MTCLNNSICATNTTHRYFKLCDYSDEKFQYYPNPDITCTRDNIRDYFPSCTNCHLIVDCCFLYSEDECCSTLTFHPTSSPTINPCQLNCSAKYTFDHCLFFETQNTHISCIDNRNQFTCCNNNRSECCVSDPYIVYGSLGSVLFTLLFLTFYMISGYKKKRIISKTYNQIAPSKV